MLPWLGAAARRVSIGVDLLARSFLSTSLKTG
jgi:hypothetical protein